MATRIIINGREVTSPFTRAWLMLSVIIIMSLVTASVLFVLLPLIGIAVTLSIGFILIFIVSSLASFVILALLTAISSRYGTTEFHIERIQRRRY